MKETFSIGDIMKETFSIGDAAKITGVTQKQLRNWEERQYLMGIQRIVCSERAYRRYSEENIEQIKAIKGYLNEGFTLHAAAGKTLKKSQKEDQQKCQD